LDLFLADRTNGRHATVLCLSSSVRNVLWLNAASYSKSYYWHSTAYRKSYMRNWLVPKWMTLTFVWRSYQGHANHCITFAIEYLGNRYRGRGSVPEDHQ